MKSLCVLQQVVHCVVCQAWAVSESRGEGRREGGRREEGRREEGRREEGREKERKGRGRKGEKRREEGEERKRGREKWNSKRTPWKKAISVPHSLNLTDSTWPKNTLIGVSQSYISDSPIVVSTMAGVPNAKRLNGHTHTHTHTHHD